MSVSPQRPHQLPFCRSRRAVALHPRRPPHRSGIRAAVRCAIPQTHRWAGAATPTQRNTTPALDRAGRASDVANISNYTGEDNTPRLAGATWPSGSGVSAGASRTAAARSVSPSRALGAGLRVLLSWLAAIPRRLGDRMFAMNDAEACWRSWQVTRTLGGLGRRYRDPQFGTLASEVRAPQSA